MQVRHLGIYTARQARTQAGLSSTNQLPSERSTVDAFPHRPALDEMQPASLATFDSRLREKVNGAVDNVWNRHDGAYQDEISALLALVDAGQLSRRDALGRLTDLDRRTSALAA